MPDVHPTLDKLRARLARRDLAGVTVKLRHVGGPPGDHRIDESIELSGADLGKASVISGPIQAGLRRPALRPIPSVDAEALLRAIGEGAGELYTRANARFLPDSLIGMITVEVDGEAETFFYLADDEQRRDQQRPLPAGAVRLVDAIDGLSRRLRRP